MNTETRDKMRADEVLGTLTGFDEIAIAEKFGDEVLGLLERRPLTGLRALLYVQKRRELTTPQTTQGKVDRAAYEAVMSMTVNDVQALITDDEDTSESGEDGAQPGE